MNNLTKKLSTIALFFLSTGFLFSCKKDIPGMTDSSSATDNSNSDVAGAHKRSTGGGDILPSPIVTTGTTTVNWNNWTNASYGLSQANQDFGGKMNYWNAYNTQTVNGMLRATMQANVVGPAGGAMGLDSIAHGSEYQLNYDIMFDNNFDFSWGGKVGFGLFLGEGNTGGDPAWDGNGGSLRLMWYKNTSTSPIILKPYVYYKDQPGQYGDDFGKAFPSNGTSLQKGVWYNVKMYVKSNTGSNTDGRVQVVINGVTLLDQAIRWTTNDLKRQVNSICFENFRGGSETYWASATNGDIYYDNVSWTLISQ
jgi:hypothetical protein